MIQLQIEPYCENCSDFEAVTDMHAAVNLKGEVRMTRCYVTCKHRERCRKIYGYLENQVEKKETEETNAEP